MKYTIEINAYAQVVYWATIEAASPEEALAKCDINAIAYSDFDFDQWQSAPEILRIEDETGSLIACDYEDDVPDIDDL
ncbi:MULTISPECIES: hypothetical protein [Xanthomonas]|uniref:Uncharacterized protein n=2 Tax=Xanthomonas TaxID=338 RepID=A0A7Z7NHQ8_XANCH|nr:MULTISPECIES: hypothetical protein [Xanthomonas]ATS40766.1 hypothetical protein XcfCFBP6988P_10515 [Xanthomonas citri pv. phaseoli var. fuscans]ATS44999.1 hypothetical protein XcfCFBP6989P_09970 [Xanthomonas citri pv. phaseoli var. fuscans]ATS49238.1 hypothetical protein XcfCFBP6990P_07385 [Xanthomonas citri pv. phaseoli var. fuscans]ATS86485.1 hypothetical protein XcfCFBP6991P_04080 [Xanthomonas citri pv. phaseoli var. fuscans]QWN22710.1 hypothetical protein DGM98_08385 [Xanthomonas citri]